MQAEIVREIGVIFQDSHGTQWLVTHPGDEHVDMQLAPIEAKSDGEISFNQGATWHPGMKLQPTGHQLTLEQMVHGLENGLRGIMPEPLIQEITTEARNRWSSLH